FLGFAQASVADRLSPAVYVGLSIALAYIEGVEQYRSGADTPQREAGEWFKRSARRILPTAAPEAIDRLWTDARCGLFHCGFTRGRTYLSSDYGSALAIFQGQLRINSRY